MWTVLQLIEASADLLRQRGSASPRVDAEWLLAHVLEQSRTWLYMNARRPVDDAERERYRDLVGRRARGEPVAYILGTAGFWTLDLAVDSRVLVPRPDTERLVELTLETLARYARGDWRIVDVGTGSGAIALALASELAEATVLATDVSADALDVARANAERTGMRERVRFARCDLLTTLEGREGIVDVVVSNPPYVADADPDLHADVRAHEPAMALYAGADGLDVFRRLLPQAHRVLVPGGLFAAEFGARQGKALAALAAAHFDSVTIHKDYGGHDRVLLARKAGASWPLIAVAQGDDDDGERTDDASGAGIEDRQGQTASGSGYPATESEATESEATESEADEARSVAERLLAEAEAAGLPLISLDEL